MKDIKEIIHLYIGQSATPTIGKYKDLRGYVSGININAGSVAFSFEIDGLPYTTAFEYSHIKLILRRLSSLTEDEAIELYQIIIGIVVFNIAITILNNAVEIRSVEHKAVINLGFDGTIVLYEEHERMIYQQRVPYPKAFIHLLKKRFWIFDESAFDQGIIIDRDSQLN